MRTARRNRPPGGSKEAGMRDILILLIVYVVTLRVMK
jgi:hypothetical protein